MSDSRKTIMSIRRWAELQLYKASCCSSQSVSNRGMTEKMFDMKQAFRIALVLLYGALAAAQDQNQNRNLYQNLHQSLHHAARRPGHFSPNQRRGLDPAGVQQGKQSFEEPLMWRFPEPPTDEAPQVSPNFELRTPTAPSTVAAVCGENSVRVEAKKDLLGIGRPVREADVTLGGCPATGEDLENQILIFESALHGCGSQLLMSDDSFVYVFTLLYTPSPLGASPIVRSREASISIQCHYQRNHEVSSGLLNPTWIPFSDKKTSEESLHFSLTIMTDNWDSPRPAAQFQLGDMMKFEASVKQFHHAPLRVTVDSCVATVVPIVDTVPRYSFLGNKGCLFDSQLTGSSSRFLTRSQDDRLRFEVEAFRFQNDHDGVVYVTCSLRATAADAAVDSSNKACSFSNGWREASGYNQACSCCDTECAPGSNVDLLRSGYQWEEETTVGPIAVKERLLR